MKKSTITWIVVGAFLLILLFSGGCTYNGMVTSEETVNKSWANVQAAYQRRFEVIPNIVNTVKGYAKHEKSTLEGVTAQRTGTTAASLEKAGDELLAAKNALGQYNGPNSGNTVDPARYAQLDRQLDLYINAVHEAYPQLQASKNFSDLQTTIESTANRVNTERVRFNEAVNDYNIKIRRFPNNIFAGLFGFDAKQPFAADQEAQSNPVVSFDEE